MICVHIKCCQESYSYAIFLDMPKTKQTDAAGGAWIFRDIPRDLMKRAKIAAAIEGRSIKALVMDSLETHLQEMEKKGLLPKGK